MPWLTSDANSFLEEYLKPGMVGFEWGSGRSTIWFANKGLRMVSVEDNLEWFEKIAGTLAKRHVNNVEYIYVQPLRAREAYPGKINDYPDEYFDLVIVDGSYRDACIRNAVSKVKPGGVVVLDNADQDIDATPLVLFERIKTSNGVWRTDLFVRNER